MVGRVCGAVEQMGGRVGGEVTLFRAEVIGVRSAIYPVEESVEVG